MHRDNFVIKGRKLMITKSDDNDAITAFMKQINKNEICFVKLQMKQPIFFYSRELFSKTYNICSQPIRANRSS